MDRGLNPGTELCFFDVAHGLVSEPDRLVMPIRGVGAIPLVPGEEGDAIAGIVERMTNG